VYISNLLNFFFMDRRSFILKSAGSLAALSLSTSAFSNQSSPKQFWANDWFRPKHKSGLGGVAFGNGFNVHPDAKILNAMDAAWEAGIRYYDTSPFYGVGLSERRMGLPLTGKGKDDYVISSKVGRILRPHEDYDMSMGIWKGKFNFDFEYDYSADGVRKSIEESLQRLGLSSIDIVFIHDLSPDNDDMGDKWTEYFDKAAKGAMPELSKMRDEGIIKGWGMGVNTLEPILKAMEVADPDISLSACQYSLIKHEDALDKLFPKAAENNMALVLGAPLCAGFLAGKDRYLYDGDFPDGVKEKRAALKQVADSHGVDLRTASLQFCAAPDVVASVIPGASSAAQVKENHTSFTAKIPDGFWAELKQKGLIANHAPVPST
jgi:D-threo-aldose 1-dehydrogenase